jgi:hypothetical protein
MKPTIAEKTLINTIIEGVYKNSIPEHYFPLIVKMLTEKGVEVEKISTKLHRPYESIAKGLAEYIEIEKRQADKITFEQDHTGYKVLQFPADTSLDGDVMSTSIAVEKKLVENYLKLTL